MGCLSLSILSSHIIDNNCMSQLLRNVLLLFLVGDTEILLSAACMFVCLYVCLLARLWKNSCSCHRETFRIHWQSLWNHAVKFSRWQHPAVGHRARYAVSDVTYFTSAVCLCCSSTDASMCLDR